MRSSSVTLPGIGAVVVHDDTRRLRRTIAKHRAKIPFATIIHHGGSWWISLNIEAADLHPAHQHRTRGVGQLIEADRWHPSTRLGPQCGTVNTGMTLANRLFTCGCGHTADTDSNAACNLAHRGRAHHDPNRSPDPQAGGRATNAR